MLCDIVHATIELINFLKSAHYVVAGYILPFPTDNVIITAGEHRSGPLLPQHTAEILDLLGAVQLVDSPLVSGEEKRKKERRQKARDSWGERKRKNKPEGGGRDILREPRREGGRESESL